MGTFVFIAFIGAVAAIAITLHNKKVNQAWADAAKKLQLPYSERKGGRAFKGLLGDFHLEAKTELVGKATWTSIRAEFPETLPFSFRLHPQTFLSSLGNTVLNRIDIDTGNPLFDSQVIVESSDSERIREFLAKRAQSAVMRLNSRFDEFKVSERGVSAKHKRLVSASGDLVEDCRILKSVAHDLWNSAVSTEPTRPIPPPLPSRKASAESTETTPPEEPCTESEPSVVALPATPTIEQSVSQPNSTFPEPEKEELSLALESDSNESLFAHHCRELLSECQGRYAMKKQFESELEGREVKERFPLKSKETYSMHKIFGRGPGTLRSFSLGELPDGNKLLLVADTDHPGEKESDTVSGKLIAFDPFTHTIYLQTHRLETEVSTA